MQPFEQKYHVASTEFIQSWTAEDLEDGDDDKVMYSYHYQDAQKQLIFRYDNAAHNPPLVFPEHKHLSTHIAAAPAPALDAVLKEILATW